MISAISFSLSIQLLSGAEAYGFSGKFSGEVVDVHRLGPIADCCYVTLGVLDQPPAIRGEVVDHPWHVETEVFEVN